MKATRPMILRIDDLTNILKQYLGDDDLPDTARPVRFLLNPRERNKLAIEFADERWNGPQGTQLLDIQLKRFYSVGN